MKELQYAYMRDVKGDALQQNLYDFCVIEGLKQCEKPLLVPYPPHEIEANPGLLVEQNAVLPLKATQLSRQQLVHDGFYDEKISLIIPDYDKNTGEEFFNGVQSKNSETKEVTHLYIYEESRSPEAHTMSYVQALKIKVRVELV